MLDRLVASLLLWGLEGCIGWFVMQESTSILTEKLTEVSRALSGM